MNLNLNGIILFVRSVEKRKQFYVNTLRLEIIEETGNE
jgi:catechol 2,3-dioxygenase-like lactoylglutathione lyase family enzyme